MVTSGGRESDDKTIGERVKQSRGAMTQVEAARQMKELGHKWSQATVWAVEKGERSVKLAEARDLSMIFGCSVLDLLEDDSDSDAYVWIRSELAAAGRASDSLLESLTEWFARRERLYGTGKWLQHSENLQLLPESKRKSTSQEVIDLVNWTLKDILDVIRSEDMDTGRLDELASESPAPFEFDESEAGDLVRNEWRQLPDPENEARHRQLMDEVFARMDDNGLDQEA